MNKAVKLPKKLNLNQNRKKQVLGGLLLFATLGSILVLVTRAAVPNIAFQSESATRSGTAELVSNDSSASGGSYVLFKGSGGGGDGGYATRKCTAGNIPGSPVYLNPGEDFGSAVNNLSEGQTLVVRAGTYTANLNLGTKSNFTICADPAGERPKISGGIGFSGANNVHIEGLEFDGNNSSSIGGIVFSNPPGQPIGASNMSAWDNWTHGFSQCGICSARGGGKIDIRYNRVWDNAHTDPCGGSGISLWSFFNVAPENDANGYNTYIVGNMLWDNYQSVPSTCIGADYPTDGNCIIIDVMDGSQQQFGGSPDIFEGNFLVANNTCSHNGGRCIQSFFNPSKVDIFYNTCYMNGTEIAVNSSSSVRIKNNIIVGNNTYSEYAAAGIEISNNIWSGGGAAVRGNGDLVADPLLTNPQQNASLGDWRPQAGSPAIAAATALIQITTDTAGNTRGSTPTIGAWQP